MDAKVVWLFVCVALYWLYCIFWGIKGALSARTATDYFISGRRISLWVFILAATATSFSGWTFIGHPGLIYSDGFQYAYASFYAIVIPLTGVIFLKRQWMLGKRFGFITPGEMLASYFRSDAIRLLVVFVALIFSIPYLGIQLRASGYLFHMLTDGALDIEVGMWLLSAVVVLYVATGGLRAVAYVDAIQAVLLAAGIIALGGITVYYVGGFDQLLAGMAALAEIDPETGEAAFGKTTPEGYSSYVAVPGVVQGVAGLGEQDPIGGNWTGTMILTYLFAMMGVQASPAFSMWAFGNRSPKPFAPQQVWASAFFIGLILMVFTAIQGIGAHFLGADQAFMASHPELVNDVMSEQLQGKELTAGIGGAEALVPQLINLLSDSAPWLVGILAVCALAAMQSTSAAYMSTTGGMLTRDVIKRFILPNASYEQQKFWGRMTIIGIVITSLIVASHSTDALVLLGGIAVAYGLQMWPALVAICWWPFLTRQGVIAGLIVGLLAVTLTDSIGAAIMPWGRWPLTVHSAGWGIILNFAVAIAVSFFTQSEDSLKHRKTYHKFLKEHAALPDRKRRLIPWAWAIVAIWVVFAIGPGAVIGNTVFGDPRDADTWLFAIPSIWTWQIIWWAAGVFMLWFLAYKMEMATIPSREVTALNEDIGDIRFDLNKPA